MPVSADWPLTTNRFIAYFDIMGFKEYIYSNPHEKVHKRLSDMQIILDEAQDFVNSIFGWDEDFEIETTWLKGVMFSDSTMLITKDGTLNSLAYLILACEKLLFGCLSRRIPIKGAISYGKITAKFEKSLFVGKPLIDAYQLENELFFYGVVFDKKAETKLESFNRLKKQCFQGAIPMKGGEIKHIAINWVNRYNYENVLFEPIDILEDFYKEVSGNPRKYVDNTIKVVREMQKLVFT